MLSVYLDNVLFFLVCFFFEGGRRWRRPQICISFSMWGGLLSVGIVRLTENRMQPPVDSWKENIGSGLSYAQVLCVLVLSASIFTEKPFCNRDRRTPLASHGFTVRLICHSKYNVQLLQ